MRKKRGMKTVKIFILVLFAGYFLIYFLFQFPVFSKVLAFADWKALAYSMLIYAAVPVVPAVIIRLIFKKNAYKYLALIAAGIVILCVIAIASGSDGSIFSGSGPAFQYTLVSLAPALLCCAFWGMDRELWIALIPVLAHFLSFFVFSATENGAGIIFAFLQYLNLKFVLLEGPDPEILQGVMTVLFMNIVFAAWAVLCVFVTRGLHTAAVRWQNGKPGKKRGRRGVRR